MRSAWSTIFAFSNQLLDLALSPQLLVIGVSLSEESERHFSLARDQEGSSCKAVAVQSVLEGRLDPAVGSVDRRPASLFPLDHDDWLASEVFANLCPEAVRNVRRQQQSVVVEGQLAAFGALSQETTFVSLVSFEPVDDRREHDHPASSDQPVFGDYVHGRQRQKQQRVFAEDHLFGQFVEPRSEHAQHLDVSGAERYHVLALQDLVDVVEGGRQASDSAQVAGLLDF